MQDIPEVLLEVDYRLRSLEYHWNKANDEFKKLSCLVAWTKKELIRPYQRFAIQERWRGREEFNRLEKQENEFAWQIERCDVCDYSITCEQCQSLAKELASVQYKMSQLEEKLGDKQDDG